MKEIKKENKSEARDFLVGYQANIRLTQNERLNEMHRLIHHMDLQARRKEIKLAGQELPSHEDGIQKEKIDSLHELLHMFMNGFDQAVLIHERIAIIDGKDPSLVNSALGFNL